MLGSIRWNIGMALIVSLITFIANILHNLLAESLVRSLFTFIVFFLLMFVVRYLAGIVFGDINNDGLSAEPEARNSENNAMVGGSGDSIPASADDFEEFSALSLPQLSKKPQTSNVNPEDVANALRVFSNE
ncbi:hypothetical protein PP175_15740 [Aneurinibacillus sp. Ricciae_BoGa-3]|uniref:hypothetical protein n=1 Tax=Aneurinibacillus sp. Ricciae_BoGa-3 TaxID=3022697 RepID=UPI002341784C|nr:hypothetical protein [Aneurinibacillus sp. Ricciae_BoGa-3]WCK52873.1 hypothetical protein PP175_15740 [Aneurinibacillus sp. Ricciae_BoGa-3]